MSQQNVHESQVLGNLRGRIQQDDWNAIEILPDQAVSLWKFTRIFKTFSTQEVQLDPKDGSGSWLWGRVKNPGFTRFPSSQTFLQLYYVSWSMCVQENWVPSEKVHS